MDLSRQDDQLFALGLLVLGTALFVQFLISSRFNPVASVLIKLQAVYWSLSHIGRSLYFWYLQPGFGEVLYDYRFASLGYHRLILEVLPYIVVGQLSFLTVLIIALAKRRRNNAPDTFAAPAASGRPEIVPALAVLLALSWLGRVGTEIFGGTAFKLFWPFAGFAAAAAVLMMPLRSRSWRVTAVVIVLGELVWTVVSASKTPALSILTALLIRLAFSKGNSIVIRMAPAILVAASIIFIVVQPLKGVDTVERASGAQNQTPLLAVIGSVVQRTDVLSPVADALLLSPRPWLEGPEYASSVLTGMVPTGLHEAVGVRWTREVKSSSYAAQYQDVYIAAGTTGEGLAQGGMIGTIVENGILCLITLGVGAAICRRGPVIALAACVLAFDSALYEGGLLWISESGSGAFQTAIIIFLISILVRGTRQRQPHRVFRDPLPRSGIAPSIKK